MPMYKVTATIEVNTQADDKYQAIDIGTDVWIGQMQTLQ